MPRGLVCIALLLLAACSDPLELGEGEWQRIVGVVEIGGPGAPRSLAAPESARAGVPFAVTVTTYGSSTCTRADGADVHVDGLTAGIIPYDQRVVRADWDCTDDLGPHPRAVTVRFDAPGQAVVRMFGRGLRGGIVTEEARVVVRP